MMRGFLRDLFRRHPDWHQLVCAWLLVVIVVLAFILALALLP